VRSDARNELLENTLTGWVEATGEMLFARATKLARKGKYIQAEKILDLLSANSRPPAKVPLLLGKIYAQQSRYEDAIVQWQRALETEPKNAEAQSAIKRAQQEMQRTKGV
jgi:cytochrome c-type biogenesis protein CcmH/NrfG